MSSDPAYAAQHRAYKNARRLHLTIAEYRVIEAQHKANKYICKGCGRKRKSFTVDHIMPRALGGPDDVSNLRPLCRRCNCVKKRALEPNREYYDEHRGQLALVV